MKKKKRIKRKEERIKNGVNKRKENENFNEDLE